MSLRIVQHYFLLVPKERQALCSDSRFPIEAFQSYRFAEPSKVSIPQSFEAVLFAFHPSCYQIVQLLKQKESQVDAYSGL